MIVVNFRDIDSGMEDQVVFAFGGDNEGWKNAIMQAKENYQEKSVF